MLSRCTDAETDCLENFCLQIIWPAAFEKTNKQKKDFMFQIVGLVCWFSSAALSLPIPSFAECGQPLATSGCF